MVCGIDCKPGDDNCNGYCHGDVDTPPAATPAQVLAFASEKVDAAHAALKDALREKLALLRPGCVLEDVEVVLTFSFKPVAPVESIDCSVPIRCSASIRCVS